MRDKIYAGLGALFMGAGIGLLITPAFVYHMIGWNLFGFLVMIPGLYFINKALMECKPPSRNDDWI